MTILLGLGFWHMYKEDKLNTSNGGMLLLFWRYCDQLFQAAFIRISSVIMCLSRQTPFHWKRQRVKRVRGIKDGIGKPFSSPYILSVNFRTHCWGPRCWQRSWCLMRCKVQALTLHTWNRPPQHTHTLFDRGTIQVSWQESSMIIAFLFTFPLPAVFTINGNSETW